MKKPAFGYEKVAEICHKLVEQGETPTMRSVRDRVGAGSMSTILEYLNRWKRENELSYTVDDDLSAEFKQAVLAECARKLSSVKDRLQAQIDESETQITEMHEVLKALEEKADELIAELEKTKNESEARHLDYEKKLSAANEQVTLRAEYANQLAQKTDGQLAELREELKKIQEAKHQADIRAATAEARCAELEKRTMK